MFPGPSEIHDGSARLAEYHMLTTLRGLLLNDLYVVFLLKKKGNPVSENSTMHA